MIETSIVTKKYRVTIPRKIREKFHIQPGQRVKIICYNKRIYLLSVPEVQNAPGYLKGINSNIDRDEIECV